MKDLGFNLIEPGEVQDNFIKLISKDWMLITAGDKSSFNTMTASWGGAGYLWNRPVVFVFIRPERYTYEFTESHDTFTLTFFDQRYRAALNLCGVKSGRNCNKIEEASLTPYFTTEGNPAFKEARIVIECKKIYSQSIVEEAIGDKSILSSHYTNKGGMHKMYVAEIQRVWAREV
jgi:flavin reductase (DIM6/NTAB) family NADH-FMN oxidoreductase RutF